ncbi:MAG: 2-dehydropantoate 2-reductase N-terminal domain-containing protein [Archangium sp.]|nr:2-dehydropantoate 2-reductase N-terminal domain-containing protein [Archangium sp.]
MRFTIFGAGAIGTLLAAKLADAGHEVAVVARGARKVSIETRGLVLRARGSTALQVVRVPVYERLAEAPGADFILVTLRAQQVDAAMEQLIAARGDVVMLVNTAVGYGPWRERLGARLVAGFPGAICALDDDGVLTWAYAPRLVQPTVVGEVDGARSERVSKLAAALRGGGVPVQVRSDLERWIRTHAGWMCPFMLTASQGEAALSDSHTARRWMQATHEGLRVAARSGPLTPFGFRVLAMAPVGLLAVLVRWALRLGSVRKQVAEAGSHGDGEGRVLAAGLLAAGEAPALRELLNSNSNSN